MYQELLSKTWTDMMNSDCRLKPNTGKRILETYGSEIGLEGNPFVIAFYNVYTGKPMVILITYYEKVNIDTSDIVGFDISIENGIDDNGKEFTEVTLVDKLIVNSLQ